MLTELRIQGLGVISQAALEFSAGLTALTGETGAGKTMIVSGLGLLLGGRADAGLVRNGSSRAVIEGIWTQLDESDALASIGGEAEDGEVLSARHILSSGRSRAFVGGVATTARVLQTFLCESATIHGQLEQIRLASNDRQRDILDEYVGSDLPASYRRVFAQHGSLSKELAALEADADRRLREGELLRFGIAEIEAVDPQPGEDEALDAEAERLQGLDDLRLLAARMSAALAGDESGETQGAIALLGEARKDAARLQDVDRGAGSLVQAINEVSFLADDVAGQLASYVADLQADPARLEAIGERRFKLATLQRKYGTSIDDVLAWAQSARTNLDTLEGSDERIASLREELATLDANLDALAHELSAQRLLAADELQLACQAELAALAMPDARLQFVIEKLDKRNAHGVDKVELMFCANAGAAQRPLAKAASGGELSRIRLALEVVLSANSSGHTFVFDEVDAGVGGTVALEIGRRLQRLATTSQVIVVTHLAQVAAFADTHLVVSKSSQSGVTTSDVTQVSGDARAEELAKMMAGSSDSQAALTHARELLDAARR